MTRPHWNPAMPYGEHADNEAAWEKQAEVWGPGRGNPMCRECVRLDAIDADPSLPCPVCSKRIEDRQKATQPQTKLGAAVEKARGHDMPPSKPIRFGEE